MKCTKLPAALGRVSKTLLRNPSAKGGRRVPPPTQCVTRPKIWPRPVTGIFFGTKFSARRFRDFFGTKFSPRPVPGLFRYQILFQTGSETFFGTKFSPRPIRDPHWHQNSDKNLWGNYEKKYVRGSFEGVQPKTKIVSSFNWTVRGLRVKSENTHDVYMAYLTIGTLFLLCMVT